MSFKNGLFTVLSTVLLSFCTIVNAQDKKEELSGLITNIDEFTKMYSQEKVYLHFDNTCYFVGDTIWFKAYLVNSVWHQSTDWSRTLYVELLTPEGDIVETKKYKVTDGQCHGELGLAERLRTGYYEVRAYTRWMQNFGDGNVFSRVFPVFEKPQKRGDYQWKMKNYGRADLPNHRVDNFWKYWKSPDKQKMEVSFFPEGGNLVKGMNSRVAFKAIGVDGENLNVAGRLLDKNKNAVTMLNTLHDGMGVFEFVPEGNGYNAEVEIDGKIYTFPLPEVLEEGCVLRADPLHPEVVRLDVRRSPALMAEWMGLTVTCRGKVFVSTIIEPSDKESVTLSFPKVRVPSGVSQITLFDATGQVFAERLVFVNHHSELKFGLAQSKTEYTPFEKIVLDVDVTNAKGQPVKTNFSLAVRDAGKNCPKGYADNILTNLLLSSDLKGYIKDPGYYFVDDSKGRRYALDLLMMVQGWSRYVWKQMAGVEEFEVINPAEESVSIDGRVLTYGGKPKPRKGAEVMMWMLSNGQSVKDKMLTDEEGRFVFAFDVWGDWDLSLQVQEKDKNVRSDIRLNRTFDPPLRKLNFYEKQMPDAEVNEADIKLKEAQANNEFYTQYKGDTLKAKRLEDAIMLEQADVIQKREWSREAAGLQYASVVYDVGPLIDKSKDKGEDNAADVFEFLEQNNPYWRRRATEEGGHRFDRMDSYKGRPVIYLINNDFEDRMLSLRLDELSIEQIELITVDERNGAGCDILAGQTSEINIGFLNTAINECDRFVVIYVYTYKDHRPARPPKGIRQTKLKGYSYSKEMYSPSYNRPILRGETDYRRTLYWNPNVQTNENGRASVSFYNNSTGKKISVSAETITAKGAIGTTDL